MSQPLVSVLMPAYNAALYIKEAVESILIQTYQNLELIIVNDGSTDNTPQIINAYTDHRIRVFHIPKNRGVVAARHLAIDNAKGEIIVWQDADDISYPNRIELQLKSFETNPALVLCSGYADIINKSTIERNANFHLVKNANIKASLFFTFPFFNPTIALRLKVVKSVMEKKHFYKQAEDYILYVNMLNTGDFEIIPYTLIQYRVHESNTRITSEINNFDIVEGRIIAWRKILNILQINTTDEILLVHDKITYYPLRISTTDKPHFIPYLQLLIGMHAANQQFKLFEDALFQRAIGHRLYSTLLHERVSFGMAMGWYFRIGGFMSPAEQLKFPLAKAKRMWLSSR